MAWGWWVGGGGGSFGSNCKPLTLNLYNTPVRTLLTLVAPTDEFATMAQNYAPAASSPFKLPVLAQFL